MYCIQLTPLVIENILLCMFVVTAVDNGASSVVVSATAVLLAATLGLLISV